MTVGPSSPTDPRDQFAAKFVEILLRLGDLERATQRLVGISSGLEADRPSGSFGMTYSATNTDRLWWHDGSGWIIVYEPWQTYTPTWVNVNLGATPGVSSGGFKRSMGFIDLRAEAALAGAGAGISGPVTFSMPAGIALAETYRGVGTVMFFNAGDDFYEGTMAGCAAAATVMGVRAKIGTVPLIGSANTAAGVPFTLGSGDAIQATIRARMNTPYL